MNRFKLNCFYFQTVHLCKTELFEIELFTCIKMDLALNILQWLICHKTKPIISTTYK